MNDHSDSRSVSTERTRRDALRQIGLVAGAAWAAPVVLDSVLSPAAAASVTGLVVDTRSLGPGSVRIPKNAEVEIELVGGGGGGGGYWAYIGGTGGRVVGAIAPQSSSYTLNYQVGGGGGGGRTNGNGGAGGAGGVGFVPGGTGGTAGSGGEGAGAGGGGGGATAIWVGDPSNPTTLVVAPGAGGSGGGAGPTSGAWRRGGKRAYSSNGALPQPGGNGRNGDDSGSTGGRGGTIASPWTAAGGTTSNGAAGLAGNSSAAGAGGPGAVVGGGGGGGGGGGYVGAGGGASDTGQWPGASGGGGSAFRVGSFTVVPTIAAAGSEGENATTNDYTGPGHSGPGTPAGNIDGGAGGDGLVRITIL